MGAVDLNDQLLNYYFSNGKITKWSRKLLIHQLNLLIMNAYILTAKVLVKYLQGEGLKNYKIPLPPVLRKKLENTMLLKIIRHISVRGISKV